MGDSGQSGPPFSPPSLTNLESSFWWLVGPQSYAFSTVVKKEDKVAFFNICKCLISQVTSGGRVILTSEGDGCSFIVSDSA